MNKKVKRLTLFLNRLIENIDEIPDIFLLERDKSITDKDEKDKIKERRIMNSKREQVLVSECRTMVDSLLSEIESIKIQKINDANQEEFDYAN